MKRNPRKRLKREPTKKQRRRWLRRHMTRVALGLVEPGDYYELMNAANGQKELLALARNNPKYLWLACRLADQTIHYYDP